MIEVVEHYEDIVAAAGYRVYGLIEGEQWLAVKLLITNRRSFPMQASFRLDTGNSRHNFRGACPLATHPEEAARLAGLIAPLYPKLLEYHGFPFTIYPGEQAVGWLCFTVRDIDVPNATLTDYRSVWSLTP